MCAKKVELNGALPTGMAIAHPSTGVMTPLSQSVFGRHDVRVSNQSLSYTVPSTKSMTFTRHSADMCSLTYNAWTEKVLVKYYMTWLSGSRASTGFVLNAEYAMRLVVNGSPVSAGNGAHLGDRKSVRYGNAVEWDNSATNRSLTLQGAVLLSVTPGQNYTYTMQFAARSISSQEAPSGYTLASSLGLRGISAIPIL